MSAEVVLSTGDAHVTHFSRRFDTLEIELVLWDERTKTVRATGVAELHDIGTWECDGIVRCPALDDGERLGYAVVDTDDNETLRFNALGIQL